MAVNDTTPPDYPEFYGEPPDPTQSVVGLVDDEMSPTEMNDLLISVAEELVDDEDGGEADEAGAAAAAAGPAPGAAGLAHGVRAIRLAVTQKGMREEPCPTNRNAYSRYLGFGPQFWCADFVSWALDRTGNRDRKVPWGYPSAVESITAWAQRTDRIVDAPRRGQIFTYRNGKHTGFVTKVRGDTFTTIEGNTSGPDGTVCWVYEHLRRDDGSYFFVLPPP